MRREREREREKHSKEIHVTHHTTINTEILIFLRVLVPVADQYQPITN